jgi:hypothetical protein
MLNHITTGLRESRALYEAGWRMPTEFCWAYDSDRIIGKIWRTFHKSEELNDIDPKDTIPAAPTPEELLKFIFSKQPNFCYLQIIVLRRQKIANVLANYILQNKLLKL